MLNLIVNIVLPSIILTKFSSATYLGPVYGLLLALSLPLGYGLYDLAKTKRYNFVSILGIISIVLTGGIGLLALPLEWVAIKEAAVPLLIGIGVLITARTKFPLVKKLLFQIANEALIMSKLTTPATQQTFERKTLRATYLVAFSFLVSGILNYVLAKLIVTSPPGTAEFTAELGRLTAYSYPVIALPSTAILVVAVFLLLRDIKTLTGLQLETILKSK
ncbi:MAG: MFS transporter [Candidatus Kerfeldbacteria bacterium]|nr:MFS transporter [Candidatus Kerfeldbacteria bacterium]